ncbi:MAG: sigma-70 family RNA polymerase sigma factor [Bacteroidetes bacterium]|jgi:RNA polymerase sigma factor (sigma-70 family)|nr:sigma-70 family RNA polymerase sigma factor [Bacteroidota bacterium]
MTETQIIEELKKGNENYLKYLYSFLPDVRRFTRQNNGDEEDAKDLLQDAIISFYENLRCGKYSQNNLKGYLLTICRNKWFDKLDKLKRQANKIKDIISINEEAEEDRQFEFRMQQRSLSEYLQDALNKLGEPCKTLIEATVYLKIRMEQVAQDYGYADAHSARQQKLRCLKRLKGFTSYEHIINLI